MTAHAPFGDVERMLEHYLGTTKERGYVVTHTPSNLRDLLSSGFVIRVVRAGGGETNNRTTDRPRIVMHVYGLADSAAPRATHDHAALVRADLMNLPAVTPYGRLDKAETESGPVKVPHPDPEVIRVQMIFRLSAR